MKIGIVSDIHNNIVALEEVLKEFNRRNIDKIICCGDIIGIGPNPEQVVQELISQKDKLITVRGNHEQYLINGLPEKVHDDERGMSVDEINNHKWTHSKLSEVSKKFIKNIPLNQIIEFENTKICIMHYPVNENNEYKKHIKRATVEENEEMFKGIDADIFIYGHTHTININNKENKWYINPGSLGCPLSSNIANVGILTIVDEKIDYEQLSIQYNVDKVIEEINKIQFPFYKGILKIFYGRK